MIPSASSQLQFAVKGSFPAQKPARIEPLASKPEPKYQAGACDLLKFTSLRRKTMIMFYL